MICQKSIFWFLFETFQRDYPPLVAAASPADPGKLLYRQELRNQELPEENAAQILIGDFARFRTAVGCRLLACFGYEWEGVKEKSCKLNVLQDSRHLTLTFPRWGGAIIS